MKRTAPGRAAAALPALLCGATLLWPPGAHAAAADCAALAEDAQRLACYDALFRAGTAPPAAGVAPAQPFERAPERAPERTQPPGPVEPGSMPVSGGAPTPPAAGTGLALSEAMSQYWELTPADKRGTFVVRTYLPTYLLPLHVTSSLNRQPFSPTRGLAPARPGYRSLEAKLRISLRAKIAEGLLLPDADLWFAYTQRSLWQVWNRAESSPFRNTDYEPEAIYVVPVPQALGELPGGWRWRMVQLGLAHQSNGQGDALSRSWNRMYFGTAAERDGLGLQLRLNHRLQSDSGDDDNPGLTRYIGNAELTANWLPGAHTVQVGWRTHLTDFRRGSLQLDWTYPVRRDNPQGLRWYVQLFTGYGETLLDYNHRQTSLGVGVALFNF
ncbi:phospholipase A [Azohydromonas lata]|uniref:Phospholipase A1 n=1 Tax=Azohydromonas lata TaxID=45677 RepID=A0ABU5IQH9_9BURK|nr:phospholipase A [Azohydromonas lata]MDZ5461143.1 phospholipase A [Azohydromonas lata]